VSLALSTRAARRLAVFLVAFGTVGLVLVIAAAVMLTVAGPSLDQVGTVTDRSGPARQALADAKRSLVDLSRSAGSLEETLHASESSLRDAAAAGRSLSDSLAALAAATNLEILGTRPFAGVGEQLSRTSEQVGQVAADIDALASRVGQHGSDAGTVAADTDALAASIDEIDASLGGPTGSGLGTSVAVVRLVLYGLLAWIGVLAAGCVLVGRRLRRATL
jgi:methyl-accepting chemotaxis protein